MVNRTIEKVCLTDGETKGLRTETLRKLAKNNATAGHRCP